MIGLIIPARYIHNPLGTMLWKLLWVAHLTLDIFTFYALIPYCERLIQQVGLSSRHSAAPQHRGRERTKTYGLISAICVSEIITSGVGLTSVLYNVSAAQHSSSTGVAILLAFAAVCCVLVWMVTALFSLKSMVRRVRKARKWFGAEAGVVEGLSPVLWEKEKDLEKGSENGEMVVGEKELPA